MRVELRRESMSSREGKRGRGGSGGEEEAEEEGSKSLELGNKQGVREVFMTSRVVVEKIDGRDMEGERELRIGNGGPFIEPYTAEWREEQLERMRERKGILAGSIWGESVREELDLGVREMEEVEVEVPTRIVPPTKRPVVREWGGSGAISGI